jgi:hypothetical protein
LKRCKCPRKFRALFKRRLRYCDHRVDREKTIQLNVAANLR